MVYSRGPGLGKHRRSVLLLSRYNCLKFCKQSSKMLQPFSDFILAQACPSSACHCQTMEGKPRGNSSPPVHTAWKKWNVRKLQGRSNKIRTYSLHTLHYISVHHITYIHSFRMFWQKISHNCCKQDVNSWYQIDAAHSAHSMGVPRFTSTVRMGVPFGNSWGSTGTQSPTLGRCSMVHMKQPYAQTTNPHSSSPLWTNQVCLGGIS